MKDKNHLRKLALVLVLLGVVLVVGMALSRSGDESPAPSEGLDTSRHEVIAVFGATGTVGDGLLKAVMNDPDVESVHVMTRRTSPRIEEGVASGLVEMTIHMDYLDYSPFREMLSEVDAVFWAIGTSATNVSKEEYGVIHVDFPAAFVKEWLGARREGGLSFHYVSGSGAKEDSSWHWAREKARAEQVLFDLAEGTNLRVISYRPGAVVHSEERFATGDTLKELLLEPFKLSVRSTVIGRAMLEASARGDELGNGTILENGDIRMYGSGYSKRTASPPAALSP